MINAGQCQEDENVSFLSFSFLKVQKPLCFYDQPGNKITHLKRPLCLGKTTKRTNDSCPLMHKAEYKTGSVGVMTDF